ncbi:MULTISPECIES: phage antirepressor protein [unclassified Pseudomonas]|uniref:phage antirepressor protein n=1 Tax=unclassified Pseudomonas TaxID=196821 RepID=UPI0016082BEB|nr:MULTISPECIES: phage antirepressor protein [unclassified Pseudomonas]MBB6287658.1 phage regulator Rha-like protein [Pseudomonas sp. SJZ073]MBB6310414.1 phage regulator Rha-like protein [Pseudomonas sp. JAI120]
MHQHTESINSPNNLAPRFLQSQNVAREVSMTSLELVDFINGQRSQEDPILDHADFMKKVPRVIRKDAGKFSDIYLDSMNRKQKCYRFPKRESCLMAMSYSYDLQAAVFDHMTSLEERLSQKVALPSYAEALRLYADQIEQTEVLRVENHQQATKIHSLENLFKEGMTHTQFCKGLNGVNVMQVGKYLEARSWLYNESKSGVRHRVGSYARDKYMTEHQVEVTPHGKDPFISYTPVLLKKGAARLYDLYLAGELPMKKTWDGLFTHDKAVRGAA